MSDIDINQINSIEREVQTSLEYISKEDSKRFRQELENLREEKKLLEGKIRGYITLSDVCHEYKSELKKLQHEYDQLKQKINMKVTEKNENKSFLAEPPTPGHDLGHGIRTELDQRTLAMTTGTTTTFSRTDTAIKPATENISTPFTALQLSRSEIQHNIKEQSSGILSTRTGVPSVPARSDICRESIPMQESMVGVAQEHRLSLSDMGFEHVPDRGSLACLRTSQQTLSGNRQQDDLMVFSSLVANEEKKESLVLEPAMESLTLADDTDLHRKINEVINDAVKTKTKTLQEDNKKLRDTIEVLTHENRQLHAKLKDSQCETRQLAMKTEELQSKLHDRNKESSPQGWVHINKAEKSVITPLKAADVKVQNVAAEVNMDSILQQNEQLRDANQKWVSEWDKLQEHFEQRTLDLRAEVERLNKTVMEADIMKQSKEAEFEQLLIAAKQKASEQEAAKEDVISQLASASQREETLQARIHQLEELVTTLRRDKQSAEAELTVVKQKLTSTSPLLRTSLPEGLSARTQQELQTEVEVLRQQLLVFQEDFDRERQDRATAQSVRDDLKKKCDQQRKQLRHTEIKLAGAETQLKNSEDVSRRTLRDNERLQQEILELKRQLRQAETREWPGFVGSGPRVNPTVQNPPFQFQQPDYRYHQQPQQYIVPAQPQPPYSAPAPMMYMAGSHPQMLRQGYYVGNQGNAGTQHENLPGAWACNSCTYVNYPGRTVCEMCGYVQSIRQSASQNNLNGVLRPRGDEPQQAASQGTVTSRSNTT